MNKTLLAKAMKYCAYQERCHWEVRGKLLELGARGLELEQIMAKLIEDDFLNEERFAITFAGGKFRQKQWGWNRIKCELQMRDISSYCIEKAKREVFSHDYEKTLLDIIIKKKKQTPEKKIPILRKKLATYAISRGFEPEMVWDCLMKLIS